MTDKIIYIESVGKVIFKHSSRAKYLSISVKPFYGVRVSVPKHLSLSNAAAFVEEKKSWIKKHLDKVKSHESQKPIIDDKSKCLPKNHTLHLHTNDEQKISLRISNGKIIISHPSNFNPESKEVQSAIKKGIIEALRIEAKTFLPVRVRFLADRFGLEYRKLSIKNIKSRWGSCSGKNNINLNVHLMRLPDYLIDYVILHELAHTVHHNHSPKFWELLNRITGNAKRLDKELKNFRIEFF
ncbi:MAG: M48 family metallopeptidase [Ignavibacteriales bacterium]|nr:M48 family metallopeptidase [Ignavibacteriales bacterium]